MATLTPELERELDDWQRPVTGSDPDRPKLPPQTDDGALLRPGNRFAARFGEHRGLLRPEPGRYRLLGNVGCGWNRRLLIIRRLVGLTDAIGFDSLYGRDADGSWLITSTSPLVARFGTQRLADLYARTAPDAGYASSPTLLDAETGLVVSNDYHTLGIDFETAWKPFHAPGAPDLYPHDLRGQIDLLNQQLYDDITEGPYKALLSADQTAAHLALEVFQARLGELDFRLATRRYLFGPRLTDSDIRLFQTLANYDRGYRPRLVKRFGQGSVKSVQDFTNLWAYARDLFAGGLADEREQYYLGLIPGPSGRYAREIAFTGDLPLPDAQEALAQWQEPTDRAGLTGSALYAGPGGGGSGPLWQFAAVRNRREWL